MDSLPTGTTQSWVIVMALALSPTAVLLLSDLVGRVLRRAKDRDVRSPIPVWPKQSVGSAVRRWRQGSVGR
jgi:Na+-translocating ferredoxin:NAD+ oxidoreductase RnfE subunit